nr:protein trichome birefringence-like 13 [Tanacetum cinerariifolium]
MFISLFSSKRRVSGEVKKWRPAGSDCGFTFLKYYLTIAYHRTNLLGRYGRWSAHAKWGELESFGYKEGFRVDDDIPEATWADTLVYYGVALIFFSIGMSSGVVAICLAWMLSFSSIVADRSYEHDNGFVFSDISIGTDIQMYIVGRYKLLMGDGLFEDSVYAYGCFQYDDLSIWLYLKASRVLVLMFLFLAKDCVG